MKHSSKYLIILVLWTNIVNSFESGFSNRDVIKSNIIDSNLSHLVPFKVSYNSLSKVKDTKDADSLSCKQNPTQNCDQLPPECLKCSLNYSCIFGQNISTTCTVKQGVTCVVSYFVVTFEHHND